MLATIIVHWQRLLYIFNISGVFVNVNRDNVSQILVGPALHTKPHLIWSNVVRALLAEVWFKINQHVFHDIFSDGWFPLKLLVLPLLGAAKLRLLQIFPFKTCASTGEFLPQLESFYVTG